MPRMPRTQALQLLLTQSNYIARTSAICCSTPCAKSTYCQPEAPGHEPAVAVGGGGDGSEGGGEGGGDGGGGDAPEATASNEHWKFTLSQPHSDGYALDSHWACVSN